jgi:AcrR family transcriptional regulator
MRKYDSSRRLKAAEQTRREILEAALKLHWEGVTEFEPLAREAGCSEATVRKHFPTKEDLFQDCTRTFGESLTMPDLVSISKIREAGKRRQTAISELCRIHEAMHGYAWFSAHARETSPVLDRVMNEYEGLADAVAQIVAPPTSGRGPAIRGLLDFLTYRALRFSGHLSAEDTKKELAGAIEALVQKEKKK